MLYSAQIYILRKLYKYRLSHEEASDISFIARGRIAYFVTSERKGQKSDFILEL